MCWVARAGGGGAIVAGSGGGRGGGGRVGSFGPEDRVLCQPACLRRGLLLGFGLVEEVLDLLIHGRGGASATVSFEEVEDCADLSLDLDLGAPVVEALGRCSEGGAGGVGEDGGRWEC